MKSVTITFLMLLTFILSACSNLTNQSTSTENKTNSAESKSEISSGKKSSEVAADFSLKSTDGDTVKLSDYKGKKVYIKYWASWCSICLGGLEELNELSKESKEFFVLSIVSPNYRGEQSTDEFTNWFEGRDYKHIKVLLDEDGTVAKKYNVLGYPTSYYISSNGNLEKFIPGHNDIRIINETIKDIH